MNDFLSYTVTINAGSQRVWQELTDAQRIVQWMSDTDMQLQVETDWRVNSPVIMRGNFHGPFENKGVVLRSDPAKSLTYTHLSSVSGLSDAVENYTVLDFTLTGSEDAAHTILTLRLSGFPDEIIRKHLELYWPVTLQKIKEQAERTS